MRYAMLSMYPIHLSHQISVRKCNIYIYTYQSTDNNKMCIFVRCLNMYQTTKHFIILVKKQRNPMFENQKTKRRKQKTERKLSFSHLISH